MPGAYSNPLRIYAVVPVEEGAGLRMHGARTLRSGALAAIIGSPPGFADVARAAQWHDRVVARSLRVCSAVVPFRSGVEVGSETDVYGFLRLNAGELSGLLGHFHGRVEMGLKARVAPPTSELLRLPFGIDRVRTLAPRPGDRREWLMRGRHGTTFEGYYLISRRAADEFWRALDDIRRAVPEVPLLGSGPWAPYNFCDAPLRRSVERTKAALEGM
ncbi:MAG: GvpL/GvpF family gas vesicle protein [Deltaproteobacteria bacterium]|nr:GvpL/GvpF family gas vesicle protein [Deltaproteobacteria bacterium]